MTIRPLQGDCRDVLATLPAESVQCVVTSPPYYGLRDYGTALWDGGAPDCDHTAKQPKRGKAEYTNGQGGSFSSNLQAWGDRDVSTVYRDVCGKCGAVRVDRQIGLEATPDEYLATMVGVFREVRRVLRRDGTCWVNVGSSYASGDKRPSRSPVSERVPANGTACTGPADYPAPDCAYPGRRDEPRDGSPNHHGRTFDNGLFGQQERLPDEMIGRDSERLASLGALPLQRDVLASTTLSSSANAQDAYGPACEDVDPVGDQTSPLAIPPSVHMVQSIDDTSSQPATLADHKRDKVSSSRACDCGSCGICWAYLAIPALKFKAKDLMMMPSLLALALQADGWFVRSDIIWAKPNPMPESTRDRPTSAHEHVFLLTRSARYYYDADAVREALQDSTVERGYTAAHLVNGGGPKEHGNADKRVRQGKGWWDNAYVPSGRNMRNVWTIATHAYPDAHFATFPPELAERCIRAGTSERGCCAACGKPWVRVTDHEYSDAPGGSRRGMSAIRGAALPGVHTNDRALKLVTTTGWAPGCQCHGHFEERPAAPDWISDESGERKMVRVWVPDGDVPPPVPCTVLDPFIGAGTTALVADRLQRDCIGVDLNVAYTEMAMERCRADAPLFTSFPPAGPPEDGRIGDLFADDERLP